MIPPPPAPDPSPRSITEAAFIERLTQNTDVATASFASHFVQEVARTPGLRLTWSKEGPALWWDDDANDRQAALLRLRASGELSATNGLASFCARHALPMSIADHYQDQLVRLLPGTKRVERGAEGYTHVMSSNGGFPSFTPLANRSDEFWKLITDTTASLAKSAEERRNQPAN